MDLPAKSLAAGHRLWNNLIERDGGSVNETEFAAMLQTSRPELQRLHSLHQVLAFCDNQGSTRYPVWQLIAGSSRLLPGLGDVLSTVMQAGADDRAAVVFFLLPHSSLTDDRPLDRLRTGDLGSVMEAASTWGRQGAR
jgi:hypothetical protein